MRTSPSKSGPAAVKAAPAKSSGGVIGPVGRFLAIFLALILTFYMVASMRWFSEGVFAANLRINAQISSAILRGLGEEASCSDRTIASPKFAMEVRRGCDALEPAVVFIAAVIALPVAWRSRVLGAIGGVTALFALNIIRILTLYYAGAYRPALFDALHLEVWQTLFVILSMALWLAWAWRAMGLNQVKPPAERSR